MSIEERAKILATGHNLLSEKQLATEAIQAFRTVRAEMRQESVAAIRTAAAEDEESGRPLLANIITAVLAIED